MLLKPNSIDIATPRITEGLSTQSRDFFEKVYQEYSKVIIGFFRKQGYSQDDAYDGLQDVYLKVIRLCQPQQLTESPKAYLLKVATNLIRDRYRKQASFICVPQDILELENIAALQPSPEKMLWIQQQMELVKKAMLELSDNHREVLLMHRIDGKTCQQIAQELQIPLRTVQRRLSNALAYCVVKFNKGTGTSA